MQRTEVGESNSAEADLGGSKSRSLRPEGQRSAVVRPAEALRLVPPVVGLEELLEKEGVEH